MSLNAVYPIHMTATTMVQAQRTFEHAAESIASGLNSYVNPADSFIASGLDTSIRSAKLAISAAETGYNFTSIADSALAGVSDSLQRIRELTIQASNGIYSDEQRSVIQAEINQNVSQIKQTLENATMNGKKTINAVTPENSNVAPVMDFVVGSDVSTTVSYDPNIVLGDMNFDVSSPQKASESLANIDEMLTDINAKRGEIGAVQSSFESAIEQQSSNIISFSSSLSNIQDTDYISAIMDLKKSQFTLEAMAKVMKTVMNSQSYVLDLLK